jgi:hypothetical protein
MIRSDWGCYLCEECKGKQENYLRIVERLRQLGYVITKQQLRENTNVARPELVGIETEGSTCCTILESHHRLLKNDPDRLSTEFIKNLSKCECDKNG